MKGDFSRGDRPDRKHDAQYRRVLMQQGRVLLDSDFNALSEALDRNLRGVVEHLGVRSGSPDLAGLVTEGRLLRTFRDFEALTREEGARLDHGDRFNGLLPTLRLSAVGQARTFDLDVGAAGSIRVHAKASGEEATLGEGEDAPVIPRGDGFEPVPVSLGEGETVRVTVPAGVVVHVGLIEGVSEGADLHISQGTYLVDGLSARIPSGADHVTVDRPAEGTHALIMEVTERLITPAEAAHLKDPATGGLDTSLRTTVETTFYTTPIDPDAGDPRTHRAILAGPPRRDGRLQVSKVQGLTDNRLYRFEIHTRAGADEPKLLWSRDNAALTATARVQGGDGQTVSILNPGFRDGDLVEVIGAWRMDGDQRVDLDIGRTIEPVTIDGDAYQLGHRHGGPLGELEQGNAPTTFALDVIPPGAEHLVLRRWDGTIEQPWAAIEPAQPPGNVDPQGGFNPPPDPAPQPQPIVRVDRDLRVDPYLSIQLTGTQFVGGDYWTYEARVLRQAKEPIGRAPDGPDRTLVLLARIREGGVDWWSEQFQPLSELRAESIGFQPGDETFAARTVQDALETLYERPLSFDGEGKIVLNAPDGREVMRLHRGDGEEEWRGRLTLRNVDGQQTTLEPADRMEGWAHRGSSITTGGGRLTITPSGDACHLTTDRDAIAINGPLQVTGTIGARQRDLDFGVVDGEGEFKSRLEIQQSGNLTLTFADDQNQLTIVHDAGSIDFRASNAAGKAWFFFGSSMIIDGHRDAAGVPIDTGAGAAFLAGYRRDLYLGTHGPGSPEARGGFHTRMWLKHARNGVGIGGDLEVRGRLDNPNGDCAELMPVAAAANLEPGDVAALDRDGNLRPGAEVDDSRVVGVVSGAGDLDPAILLGSKRDPDTHVPIAMMGTVYVKADAIPGPIAVGDLLTTSATPGHAMRVVDRTQATGAIIGKALEPLAEGRGLIKMLVALQ